MKSCREAIWTCLLLVALLAAALPARAGSEFAVCTAPGYQYQPAVSGQFVVWVDSRNDTSGNDETHIYAYDLSAGQEFPLVAADGWQASPAISGDLLAWEDARGGIYGRNLPAGVEFLVSGTGRNPALSGSILVSEDFRNRSVSGADVYGHDLSAAREFPICVAPDWQWDPAISGNTVVWADWRNRGTTSLDIYGYDLSSGQEFPVAVKPDLQMAPAVSGNMVVWEDHRNYFTSGADIYGCDLSTGQEILICGQPDYQYVPAISGNIVVWVDMRNDPGDWSNTDIYGYDLSTGEEFPICTAPGSQEEPAVFGDIVVWRDWRNDSGDWSNSDIYGYRLELLQPDSVVFEPPLAGNRLTLRSGRTLPIKFHLVDSAGNPILERRNVSLEVSGLGPRGTSTIHIFSLADETLRFDASSSPPHYQANFHTRRGLQELGGRFCAVVKQEGIPIGSVCFELVEAGSAARGGRLP